MFARSCAAKPANAWSSVPGWACLFGGYLTHQTISWDAYHEASDLENQAETYRLLTGHYPELIQWDKIYHTNDNRKCCSKRGIRMTALPKGPKPNLSAY